MTVLLFFSEKDIPPCPTGQICDTTTIECRREYSNNCICNFVTIQRNFNMSFHYNLFCQINW